MYKLIGTVDLPTSGQKIVLVGICEISGRNLDAVWNKGLHC